jgi:carbohydrate-selective porin OprB
MSAWSGDEIDIDVGTSTRFRSLFDTGLVIGIGVDLTHLGGWSFTPATRSTTAARGAARSGDAYIRSAAAGNTCTEGFDYRVHTRHFFGRVVSNTL